MMLASRPFRTCALVAGAVSLFAWAPRPAAAQHIEEPPPHAPTEADELLEQAGSLSGARRFAEAIAELDRAIAIEPSCAPAHRERGYCYYRLGDFAECLLSYARGMQLDPSLGEEMYSRRYREFYCLRREPRFQALLDRTCYQPGGCWSCRPR